MLSGSKKTHMKKYLLLPFYLLISNLLSGQSFTNFSLELWSSATVCETNTPPDGWTDYSNVGIGPDEGNLSLCPSTIPPTASNGNIYARCLAGNPNTGEGMFQYLTGLTIGLSYTISYDYCGSNRWGGSGDCVWHLFLDDVDVNQSAIFSSADTVWHTNNYSFVATSTTHKVGVRAYTPTYNGGGSAAIDRFIIEHSKSTDITDELLAAEVSVYPNPFNDNLTINTPNNQSSKTFTITDILGKVLFHHEFVDLTTVTTDLLPSGIYLYEVRNDNVIFKQGKLVKE